MKIERFHASHLRNDAHFQFHTDFRKLLDKCGAERLKVKQQFDAYNPLYMHLDEALKKINKSALTEEIHARDEIYSAIV